MSNIQDKKYLYIIMFNKNRLVYHGDSDEEIADNVYQMYRLNGGNKTYEEVLKDVKTQKRPNVRFSPPTEYKEKKSLAKMTLSEVWKGGLALIKFIRGQHVPQSEVIRRSEICLNCPLIESTSNCLACGGSRTIVNQVASLGAAVQIPDEIKSRYCGFCKCSLSLMVVSKPEQFKREHNRKDRPAKCWVIEIE